MKISFLIEADKARISQVVSNLLLNALKFTNKDCLIQVIVEKKEISSRRKRGHCKHKRYRNRYRS